MNDENTPAENLEIKICEQIDASIEYEESAEHIADYWCDGIHDPYFDDRALGEHDVSENEMRAIFEKVQQDNGLYIWEYLTVELTRGYHRVADEITSVPIGEIEIQVELRPDDMVVLKAYDGDIRDILASPSAYISDDDIDKVRAALQADKLETLYIYYYYDMGPDRHSLILDYGKLIQDHSNIKKLRPLFDA